MFSALLKKSARVLLTLAFITLFLSSTAVYADLYMDEPKRFTTTADTWIFEAQPDTNYGSAEQLRVGIFKTGASEYRRRSLLKFDLSQIPTSATISSAVFGVVKKAGNFPSTPVSVYRVGPRANWQEYSATWGTRPDWIDPPATYRGERENIYTWDVTNIVKQWVSQQAPNYGLYMLGPNNGTDYVVDFYSRANSNAQPFIDITYTTPSPSPAIPSLILPTPDLITRPLASIPPNFGIPTGQRPVISGVIWTATSTTATIFFRTDIASTGVIYYSQDTRYNLRSSVDNALTQSHSITISGLSPSTSYNYKIASADRLGTVATTSPDTFITTASRAGATPQPVNEGNNNEPVDDNAVANDDAPIDGTNNPEPDQPGGNVVSHEGNTSNETEPGASNTNPFDFMGNFVNSLEKNISDSLIQAKAQKDLPMEGTASATTASKINPVVYVAGTIGVNTLVGIILVVTGILAAIFAFFLLKATKKMHKQIWQNSNSPDTKLKSKK